jgi:flagellar motility protein MotE (MotC chaperone)
MSGKASGYQKFFKDARKSAIQSMTPEQQVMQHLTEQSRRRQKAKRSKRRPPPVFAIVLLAISIAAGTAGAIVPNAFDSIESFQAALTTLHLPQIPKVSIGFLGLASASESAPEKSSSQQEIKPETKEEAAKKVAGTAESAGDKGPAVAPEAASKGEDKTPDLKQWTTEEMSFFKRLNERKIELDRREAELAKLEEELQKQRVGIEGKIKQLETMRAEISATLKGRVEQDQEKVANLIDVYSNMKPASASRVIETLNEDLAVTILDRMKKKNAAEILNMMSAQKAKKLSEMLTGYRQPASTTKAE